MRNKTELKIIYCLFEQSGVFKNEFKKLGYTAYDFDILNDFNETDFQIDLFFQIELAYEGKKSIFDKMNTNDLIFNKNWLNLTNYIYESEKRSKLGLISVYNRDNDNLYNEKM